MIKFIDVPIEELFHISTGRDIIINSISNGSIPLVSHQHSNNGISKYIKRIENRRLFNYKDTIALADRGVFLATTQKEDFHIGTRVKALTFKSGEQSENVRLYFVTAINKLQVLFEDYLNNATDKLPKLLIKVPVNESGNIDYEYIENNMNTLKNTSINRLKTYLKDTGLENYEITPEDEKILNLNVRYQKYRIGDLFNKLKTPFLGKGDKKNSVRKIKTKEYCVPVVYAKKGDNGIMYWAKEGAFTTHSKVLSIIYNGAIAAGLVYAHEEETGILAESYMIKLKKADVDFKIYLYLQRTIENVIYPKYSRDNLATWDNRVENDIIYLPTKDGINPDYEYMKKYMEVQEKLAIKKLLYIESV